MSVATISTRKEIESYPAVTLVSYSDGILGNGTGVPYLYLTPLDFTAKDLAVSNRTISLSQSSTYALCLQLPSVDKIASNTYCRHIIHHL